MRKHQQIKGSFKQGPMHFAPTAIEHEQRGMSRSAKAALTAVLFILIIALGFCIAAVHGFTELRGF